MKVNLLLFVFILAGSVIAQSLKIKADLIYTIGNDVNPKKEYMFVRPALINADSKGNIYLLDSKSLVIRKYGSNGGFVKKISRSGDGPGEFRNIENFIIDDEDNLIITDLILERKTVLNTNGDLLSTSQIPHEYAQYSGLAMYGKNHFLMIKPAAKERGTHGNKFIILSDDYKNTVTSFGSTTFFWNLDEKFGQVSELAGFLNCIVVNENIVVASRKV